MAPLRILFSNLGYARQIDGSLRQHVQGITRHFSCPTDVQQVALQALRVLLHVHQVDIACLAEIDAGSSNNHHFNQLHYLRDATYRFSDVSNKYGNESALRNVALSRGKSNGWLSRFPLQFERRYLSSGTKRLVYFMYPPDSPPIVFGHFSLRAATRQAQFKEIAQWIRQLGRDVILLGDFNNYRGEAELAPLLDGGHLRLLGGGLHTFNFSGYQATVDLCLASDAIASQLHVQVIPQHFSDHHALLVEWRPLGIKKEAV
ncbi:MAG: endonuclease/exonuclease/phosphatase family protein [Rickettsiales bacterium]|nr:endonuclease/exonuclease/phosphatase family protein [Rickettsiales bacterium]